MNTPVCTPVYLDHNATTTPRPEAVAAMLDVLRHTWANASSTHAAGQAAQHVLVDARRRVARLLGCQPAELVFTSGATEANCSALRGALAARRAEGRQRLMLSAVEHPGLIQQARQLQDEGVVVDWIPVNAQGVVDLDAARRLLGSDVAVVACMAANNETGVLMPTAALAERAQACGAWLLVDATQLAGRLPLDFARSGADLLAVSAHKLGGPKGIGALVVRRGLSLAPLMPGRQERQRRGGTENLPAIAGFAAACDQAAQTLAAVTLRTARLRDRLEAGLQAALQGVHIYGLGSARLPNTSCLRVAELDAEQVLLRLERAGVLASSGAACSAGGTQPSHVLLAMGERPTRARAAVRFSLGSDTTEAEVDFAVAAATRCLGPLLREPAAAPAW